ncbi:MAG: FAD-dependent oxidoreductase [Bacteroidota bacterium]|nr:thioredoxin-disulfide reductase [Odoribacter sp.]MDP3644713.1 FAD-dependent oxidoreductase [Bacteroidota bacterium]
MKEIISSDYEKEVLAGQNVLVDFYSTECPPCEAVAPKLETLEKLFGKEIKFVKIFRQGNRDLADQLAVKSSPTLLFYQDGEEVSARLTGGVKRSEIVRELKHVLGKDRVSEIMKTQEPTISDVDVAILGAGPGGLTAGLYLCQARINTVLVDIALPGGNVSTTHMVSNYPGFIDPQPGYMLSHNMSEQTKRCGTTYKVAVDVTHVDLLKKEIVIDSQETIRAKRIIIATGTSPNRIGIPGELEFKGQGISYCATCDAKYFVDKEVVVIGGGNSAIEEADFISKFASKITIVHQFDQLQANKIAQEKVFENPKFSFLFSHEPRAFKKAGDKMVVEVEDLKTKEMKTLISDGIFVFIGQKPNLEMFGDKLKLDQWGYIQTDEDMRTNIDGVYAVGDVGSKKYRQITTAIADGTIAAISITREIG